jgi:hypothetical protein
MVKKMINLVCSNFKVILHAVNSYKMGLTALIPSEGMSAADFYRPFKSTASAGFEPTNIGSNGKHANHYIITSVV